MPTLDTIVVEVIERGPQGPALSNGDRGDITVAGNGDSLEINAGAVGNEEFRDGTALSVVGRASNSTGDVADIAAGTDHHVLRRSGTSLGFGLLVNANVDSAAGIAASKISFTQAGTGAVARLARNKMREIVTPQDFTASTIDDYTTDASSAIQAAIDYAATTGKQVYIPAGTYKVGTALEVKGNGTCLVGDGWLSTILKSPNAGNDIITFAGGISSVQVIGIGLDRAVTPNTGVAGLRTPENSWIDCTLRDIWSRRSAIGFVLGATAYGKGFNLRAELNTEHGFHQTAGDVATSPQWYLNGIYSGSNGGDGYLITTDAASVAAAACGEITDLQIYGNSGRGFAAIGTAAAPIQSIRLKNKIFIGQDGSHSIYLDTYGTNHELQGLHLEETGTTTTGPTQSDAASWEGHGLMITANNNTVHLSDALINGHSWSGIHSSTPLLITKDVVVKNNGRALDSGHAYRSGIHIAAGVLVGDPSTAGTSDAAQQYGVSFAADGAHHLDGHDLRGNSAAPIAASVSVPTLELSGGYPAEVRCTDVDTPDLVLSLATGNPYPAGTLTNQVTLYLTPAGRGRKLPLFNGVNWSAHNSGELSYAINESTISPEAAGTDKNYDVFAFYDRASLAPKISKGFPWSSSTARGTGSGTTELELFNGFWVNKYDITNAATTVTIPARQGLYLGTFRSNVSTYIDFNFHNVDVNGSGAANRCSVGIWNMFNRRDIVASWYTSASSWTYSSQTVRQRNAQANDKLVVISGLAADDFSTSVDALMTSVDVSVAFWRGFGLDSTSTFYGAYGSNLTEAAGGFPRVPVLDGIPAQIGFHELTVLERIQQAAKSATAYGGRQHSTALVRWRA